MMALELVKLCIWSLWDEGRLLPPPALGEHSLDPGEQRAMMRTSHIYRARVGEKKALYGREQSSRREFQMHCLFIH